MNATKKNTTKKVINSLIPAFFCIKRNVITKHTRTEKGIR